MNGDLKYNKEFRNQSDVSNELFKYLGKVRDIDAEDIISGGIENNAVVDGNESSNVSADEARVPGNAITGTLTKRIQHISTEKPAYVGQSGIGRAAIMPHQIHRKRANNDTNTDRNIFQRIGNITLKGMADARRKIFANSSLLEGLTYGGLVGLGTYALAPAAYKWFGTDPIGIDRRTGKPVYVTEKERRYTALAAGLGVLGLNALRGVNTDPDKFKINQLWTMPKRASMLGPIDYVPTQFALNAVTLDPNIPDSIKYNTLHALGTIDSPMINSTDMVNAGISSGVSGATGVPVGRIAAAATADALTAYGVSKLMGSSNAGGIAGTTGVLSILTRSISNAFN